MLEEVEKYVIMWEELFKSHFVESEVPNFVRTRYAKNLVENDVFSLKSLGKILLKNETYLQSAILIKNEDVAREITV